MLLIERIGEKNPLPDAATYTLDTRKLILKREGDAMHIVCSATLKAPES